MAALPEPLVTVQSRSDIDTIASRVDLAHEEKQEAPRPHLGASLLGHPCDRWLWLTFRWAVVEKFSGRMLRLFRRGQLEEKTIVEDLRAIGIYIRCTCLDEGQSRVDFGAHVSGSIDGIIEQGVPGAERTKHIAEFKTHSLKSFNELKAKGVKEAKRQHWCQMQIYMLGKKLKRALYVAVCKDNDEMYTERIYFDEQAATALVARGRRITLSERMPEPLSADPSWWQCKFCPAYDFCHKSHCTKEVNCRTCCHVTPCENSTFTCALCENEPIPYIEQLEGCERHVLHPDLVPWQWKGGTVDGRCGNYVINGISVYNGEPSGCVYTSKEILELEPFRLRPFKEMELPF